MNVQPLYDLTPLASLLGFGALLAFGPLAWVYWRNRHTHPLQRLQALRLFTLYLTFDLILFGAFTRLTDSGLGCPDWPGCYGNTSPFGASHAIAAAQAAMPSGPVTQAKAWIEMIHRYLATGVGALIVAMTVASWLSRRKNSGVDGGSFVSGLSPWWATATLVWVCLQGAFGALTVTMKLFPAIVTLHLAGALVLLALLCVQVVRGGATPVRRPMSAALHKSAGVAAALLAVQILLGGWVSTNYAVLACSDFPLCQNRWWPEMNFSQGFELWRHLGVNSEGESISFAALTAIHYAHRLMAYGVLIVLALLAWQLNRRPVWRRHSRALAALVGLQLATGLSNVVLDWPLLAALMHTGGAAALVLVLTWTLASAASVAPDDSPVKASARAAASCAPPEPGKFA
ncbi:MAG: COX15/CtaA family protein [Rhodoferax sp.]|uniref:COX15/CtaA family protein n=1 Tax=Rhodoferax sp. TaxID=50421 RepID=UPI0026056882|nr:COX15/CtaA family protein [Rhodoferax sp.]MDD2879592.1 COX15/CtaA family protein [Rhodoferax sp.]